MRRIFDDLLRPVSLRQRPEDVIHPPLPNVSRQLQPLYKRRQGRDAAPNLHRLSPQEHKSDRDDSRIMARSASPSSSESSSNDSIYLEAERLNA